MRDFFNFVVLLLAAHVISVALPGRAFGVREHLKAAEKLPALGGQRSQPDSTPDALAMKQDRSQQEKDSEETGERFANVAQAQVLEINAYVIAGGGGTSSSGAFQLDGTVGQPAAGSQLSAPSFNVNGGFWTTADIPVVQKKRKGQITSQ